jgi:hypothetical protein
MTAKDDWGDTLRRREKAEEDRYFAEQDRRLIERRRRQHAPSQEADPRQAIQEAATVACQSVGLNARQDDTQCPPGYHCKPKCRDEITV